jgi:DNA-binding CsgD family transcriptional regulator/CheY-like chemotaxis protein
MSGGGLGDLVLLLVDDEIEQVAPIVSIAERCGWDVFCATSTAQARERLCGGHVASVFVDLVLFDEAEDAAFVLIDDVLASHRGTKCAAMSKTLNAQLINRVAGYGVPFISKQCPHVAVPAFLRRSVVAHVVGTDKELEEVVIGFVQNAGLSKREAEITAHIVSDYSREEICNRLGITRSTLKTHAASILEKVRDVCRQEFYQLEEIGQHLRRSARSI